MMVLNRRQAYIVFIGLYCLFTQVVLSQDQKIADSLIKIYEENRLVGIEKLELLRDLSFNQRNDIDASLKFAEELIELSMRQGNNTFLYSGYLRKGGAHILLGNVEKALEAYIQSAEAAVQADYLEGQGTANMSIADVYVVMGNTKNAETYYNKAIAILRTSNDSIALAAALLNAGDAYFNFENFDKALEYFQESGIIYEKRDYQVGKAYNKGNLGMVFAKQGKDELAEANINEAITILEELQDYYPIAVYLTYMSDIYVSKGEWKTAIDYAKRSLTLAEQYGLKEQISDANLKLSELYEEIGDQVASFKYYKDYITYRDSVVNLENVQKAAALRNNFEISQKEIEVDLAEQREKNQRNIAIGTGIVLFLIGILAIGLFRRNTFIRKTKQIIEEERDRSDNLLLNILPEETAAELKANGAVKAKKYDAVTVLFTDFKGFTSYSEKLSPEALVETISFYFSKFDAIIEKYGLEKIKTIGDAYMCAGGLHDNTKDHAHRMVTAAFEIASCVEEAKKDKDAKDLTFDIRIGINTGPVVAGVVGTKKFAYDIWGDAVNVASRMESMSQPGKINISENTYALIKEEADCEYRGEIQVKNRGMMKMYFVNDIKDLTSKIY